MGQSWLLGQEALDELGGKEQRVTPFSVKAAIFREKLGRTQGRPKADGRFWKLSIWYRVLTTESHLTLCHPVGLT